MERGGGKHAVSIFIWKWQNSARAVVFPSRAEGLSVPLERLIATGSYAAGCWESWQAGMVASHPKFAVLICLSKYCSNLEAVFADFKHAVA